MNLSLITARNIERQRSWDQALVCNTPATLHSLSIKEGNYLLPLYLYPSAQTSPSPSGGPGK